MEQLKKEGYEIEAIRNKGYRLIESPDVMSQAEIESLIKGRWAGVKVVYYKETDSTNTRAKEAGEKGEEHGALFVAERQSAGKGRRGRGWESPAGTSIYMTILLHPDILPVKAPQLTPLMAVAVVEGIRKVTGLACKIKWPNDVIIDGRKVCGILTEMSAEIGFINYVVIGVGINVNQEEFPEELQDKAVSLKMELDRSTGDPGKLEPGKSTVRSDKLEPGGNIRRSELIAAVMEEFEACYETFLKTEDLSGIKEKYNSLLVNLNQEVKVLEPGNEYEAHALGINNTGELIVRTKDGKETAVYAGEVSVRGVYGYV